MNKEKSLKLNGLNLNPIWDKVSDNYTLEKHLGTGSYGDVLKARCKSSGDTVAIKLIRHPFADSSYSRKIISEV